MGSQPGNSRSWGLPRGLSLGEEGEIDSCHSSPKAALIFFFFGVAGWYLASGGQKRAGEGKQSGVSRWCCPFPSNWWPKGAWSQVMLPPSGVSAETQGRAAPGADAEDVPPASSVLQKQEDKTRVLPPPSAASCTQPSPSCPPAAFWQQP